VADVLADVAALEILQAPGITFSIPDAFSQAPRLTGTQLSPPSSRAACYSTGASLLTLIFQGLSQRGRESEIERQTGRERVRTSYSACCEDEDIDAVVEVLPDLGPQAGPRWRC
jgi:hypothetical protein